MESSSASARFLNSDTATVHAIDINAINGV